MCCDPAREAALGPGRGLELDLVDFQRRVFEFLPRFDSESICQRHTAQRAVRHSAQPNREIAPPRTPLAAGHAREESAERPGSGRLDTTIPSVSIPIMGR